MERTDTLSPSVEIEDERVHAASATHWLTLSLSNHTTGHHGESGSAYFSVIFLYRRGTKLSPASARPLMPPFFR